MDICNEIRYLCSCILGLQATTITSFFSASAAICSAYVTYRNRVELKEYHIAEKKAQKRKELVDKYKCVILDRRLSVIDEFYTNCSMLLDTFLKDTEKEPSTFLLMQNFSSQYSKEILMFRKNLVYFIQALDEPLAENISHNLEDYQDKIISIFDDTFNDDTVLQGDKYPDIKLFVNSIRNLIEQQQIDIIRTIISYEPQINT